MNEKYRHIQRGSAVALDIRDICRRPKALRNDRADVSHQVIEEPSRKVVDVSDRRDALHGRMEEQEGAIQKNELDVALIEVQKLSEIS